MTDKKENNAIFLGAIFIAMAILLGFGFTEFSILALGNESINVNVTNTINESVPNNNQNDFFLDIAQGKVEGYNTNFKFGRNPSVGTTEEVLWDIGGTYIFLDTAEQLSISSDNILDNGYLNLSGAWSIIVSGLDANYVEISEFIILNGTSPVTTTQLFLRTNRVFVLMSGAPAPIENSNEGFITIEGANTGIDQAGITEHTGQTLMLVYTIPANHTGYVTGISLNAGQGKQCLFRAKVKNCIQEHCSFSTKYSLDVYENTFFGELKVPFAIPEKLDLVITAEMSATPTATAGGSIGIILIEN